MKKIIITIINVLFVLSSLVAQNDTLNIHNLTREQVLRLTKKDLISLPMEDLMFLANKLGVSMDELLTMQLTVSSKKQVNPRESPGIVSVITREEIMKSGARDLIDVLSRVPGISFGYDVDGVVGLGMRGNWGLEGKILVLMDGQELNEGMYGTVNFGNHFSPDQIERIEIIRGPGSSLYGGYAELGVINIVTRNAKDIHGIDMYVSDGEMKGTNGLRNAGLQIGKTFGKTDVSILGYYGTGHRSEKDFSDFDGTIYRMGSEYSRYESQNLNVGVKNGGFSSRIILDNYSANVTGYSDGTSNNFSSFHGDVSYNWKLSDHFKLIPRISYRQQYPYELEDTAFFYRKRFSRLNNELNFDYDPLKLLNITGGMAFYQDFAKDQNRDPSEVFRNGTRTENFSNYSVYVQGLYKLLGVFNLVAGGRYDYHSHAGGNFAPRVGVTSVFNDFHFKVLFSKAFRTPSIENIDVNPGITSEHTTIMEFETGLKLNANMFITANVFDITIKNPIIYEYNPFTHADIYLNYKQTGSRGAEFQYTIRYSAFSLDASYSFYNSRGKNTVDSYKVFSDNGTVKKEYLQGMPLNKFTLSGSVNMGHNLSVSPSFVLWGKRYGFTDSNETQSEMGATPLLNLYVNYDNLAMKGLSVGVGAYNLFNETWSFIQPYGVSMDAVKPYPAVGREILVKVTYHFELTRH